MGACRLARPSFFAIGLSNFQSTPPTICCAADYSHGRLPAALHLFPPSSRPAAQAQHPFHAQDDPQGRQGSAGGRHPTTGSDSGGGGSVGGACTTACGCTTACICTLHSIRRRDQVASAPIDGRKLRILCLHGYLQNAEVCTRRQGGRQALLLRASHMLATRAGQALPACPIWLQVEQASAEESATRLSSPCSQSCTGLGGGPPCVSPCACPAVSVIVSSCPLPIQVFRGRIGSMRKALKSRAEFFFVDAPYTVGKPGAAPPVGGRARGGGAAECRSQAASTQAEPKAGPRHVALYSASPCLASDKDWMNAPIPAEPEAADEQAVAESGGASGAVGRSWW